MTTSIGGTTGVTFPDASVQNTAATGFGFKNRIINGAMVIDQRNAGASVTQTTTSVFTVDRWAIAGSVASKFTAQQNAGSVTPPAGYKNYLGMTSSSAYSVGSSERFIVRQTIEGVNVADLGWGAAGAQTVTLSFWVRSSLTGSFGGSIGNNAGDRSYPFSYTISAANTWEQKTVTIPGDTTGTWVTDTTGGLWLYFSMGCGSTYSGTANTWAAADYRQPTGSTSVVGTNGATFYITGVQLEKGSTATIFDYRPYGTELALCQRYCVVVSSANNGTGARFFGTVYGTGVGLAQYYFPVNTRVKPTGISVSSANLFQAYSNGSAYIPTSITFDTASTTTADVVVNVAGAVNGTGFILSFDYAGAKIEFTGIEL